MTPPPSALAAGIALLCDEGGNVREVVRDDWGLTRDAKANFVQLVDRLSVEKAAHFLTALRKDGASFGWDLKVQAKDHLVAALFNGSRSSDGFLIVGSTSASAVARLSEALLSINNEQTTALRAALKELSLLQRTPGQQESDYLDEFSKLNNELVTLQRDLAKKNSDLARLNRLKDTFLGMASHDLRKPVSAILIAADTILETSASLNPEDANLLQAIKTACKKLVRQLNDFLDIAQIEAGKLRVEKHSIDLFAVVRNRVEAHKRAAQQKQITITATIPEKSVDYLADADRIEQAIDNLVENAIKYSPRNSSIQVEMLALENEFVFGIKDQGPGLTEAQIAKLFQPFSRVGSAPTGGETSSGLGLAIVKAIIEAHSGRVSVESNPGQGAAFRAVFPKTA